MINGRQDALKPTSVMDRYLERRLVGLHEAGSATGFKVKFIAFIAGICVIFILPFLHLGKSQFNTLKPIPWKHQNWTYFKHILAYTAPRDCAPPRKISLFPMNPAVCSWVMSTTFLYMEHLVNIASVLGNLL